MSKLLLALAAILGFLPAALWPLRRESAAAAPVFLALLAVAVAGPAAYVAVEELPGPWRSGFSASLWITVAASAALFAGVCLLAPPARGLAPLMFGYLALLALGAAVWAGAPAATRPALELGGWLGVHIVFSVLAYALATVAAVAGAAVFVKQRALKRKRPGRLSRALPPVAEAERLQVRLLALAGGVLGLDILIGMATEYAASGVLLRFEHKPLLSLLAFAVIVGLLALHVRTGVRGRGAARGVLIAYLLLTLGYPGVKFVTDVLLS